MERQFCSDLMRERGEPLLGTGLMLQRHLFIRWKHGAWRVPRFPSAGMSDDLNAAIQEAQTKGFLGLMDRRDGIAIPALLSFPENRSLDVPVAALPAAIRDWTLGETAHWRQETATTILCCTDGKRDPCCAKHGFATFKTLAKHADPAIFRLVESTHLGGCRFAATIAVLPRRERYGRVAPEQVPDLLKALAENRRYLPAYRGHADFAEAGQVAEFAAQAWWQGQGGEPAEMTIIAPVLPKEKDQQPAEIAVQAAIGETMLSVRLQRAPYRVLGSSTDIAKGGKEQSRWVASGVDVVAPTRRAEGST